jgi:hypothetical protein
MLSRFVFIGPILIGTINFYEIIHKYSTKFVRFVKDSPTVLWIKIILILNLTGFIVTQIIHKSGQQSPHI